VYIEKFKLICLHMSNKEMESTITSFLLHSGNSWSPQNHGKIQPCNMDVGSKFNFCWSTFRDWFCRVLQVFRFIQVSDRNSQVKAKSCGNELNLTLPTWFLHILSGVTKHWSTSWVNLHLEQTTSTFRLSTLSLWLDSLNLVCGNNGGLIGGARTTTSSDSSSP